MERKNKKRVSKEMEGALEDSNVDYSFLRTNAIPAKTALRLLALAYQGELGGETKENGT